MTPTRLFLAAAALAASMPALAHGPSVGPHGGPMADIGAFHGELAIAGNDLLLYVTDGDGNPVDVAGAKAEAIVLADKQTQKVVLAPAGASTLKGPVKLPDSPPANPSTAAETIKIVAALTMPGQKLAQARYEIGRPGQ